MSRIGKQSITIPKGLDVSLQGTKLIFKNAKLQKELETFDRVKIELKDGILSFGLKSDEDSQARAFWGTYRALANNIVVGLTSGFTKQLEINGVGYKATIKGKILELMLGFSHPINYDIPDGVEMSLDKNILTIKGVDKQQVGQIASEIRAFRPPEPYKGKGVKYVEETILRKAGKTAKK
ncbi:50S ribosomal protein L6 [Helicobacter sp. 16-1353]|uniref:50S ribosomal protein L6 n=1 Tax=Helicobacter sp. 16-1353 TaxID=2004996 RepID=UPI000DCD1336|nr:50S ribosomal protein L6 [Helicobacter sp. 16-1353]RAX53027.1 50S ribosomal protein L6 [Helicobacter sp. 16-1353]